MDRIQRRVFVSGRVQGVGFRRSTEVEAGRFSDLRGFVRNLEDGRVEAVFQGEQAAVLKMVAWCGRGPAAAQVKEIDVIEEKPDTKLERFGVK